MFNLETALAELSRYNSCVTDIRREVQLYEQLYCFEDSLKIVNAELKDVFKIIQRSMFVSMLTRIAAAFDSKAYKENANLSLDYFEHKYREYASDELSKEFVEIKSRYDGLNIKALRHKLIAHNDLEAALGRTSISHSIKDGDVMKLLNDARNYCIKLCYCLPGGIQTVLQIQPWELTKGNDGHEMLRRVALDKLP